MRFPTTFGRGAAAGVGARSTRPANPLIVLILLISISAAIRIAVLYERPVWKDENHTLSLAGAPLAEITHSLATDVHPPLYFIVVRGWARVFGDSVQSLRGFSALCGVALLPLLYVVGRSLVGRDAALAAVLFSAFSPIHTYYSAEARSYTFADLLVFFSIVAFLKLTEECDRRWIAAYVASTTAAFYTHYWTVFVVLAQNLYWIIFVRPVSDRRWMVWIGAQIAIGAMLIPLLVVVPGQIEAGHGDWMRAPALDAPLKTLFRFTAGWDFRFRTKLTRGVEAVLSVPFLAVLAAGVLPSATDDERRSALRRGLTFLFVVPIIASHLFSLCVKPMYVIGRFEVIVFPVFALLLGRGFVRSGTRLRILVLVALAFSSAMHLAFFFGITTSG